MPLRGHAPARMRIHLAPEQQQLFIKMIDGRLQGSALLPAKGKGPGDSHSPHGVQPVRVLYDHPLQGRGTPAPVSAERDLIDDPADSVSRIRINLLLRHERSGIGIVFRMEKLMVIRIMEDGRQRDHPSVTLLQGIRDGQGIMIDTQGMVRVMAAGAVRKELCDIFDGSLDDGFFLFPADPDGCRRHP